MLKYSTYRGVIMSIDDKIYQEFLDFQDKYFDNYSLEEREYIRKYIFTDLDESYVDIVSQVSSKIGCLPRNRDRYLEFINIFTNDFDSSKNILEVASGRYPIISYHLSRINPSLSITSMDPRLVTNSLNGIKLVKKSFTIDTDISSYDVGISYFPCEATLPFVKKFCTEGKDFIVGLCGCTIHFPSPEFSQYRTYTEKEWFDYVLSVVMSEKKDNCNVLVKKLPNSYNCNYPIIEGKHQR